MSRSQRLFSLMQLLRRCRRPVSGTALAQELGISTRTLYRDIAMLQTQGARIDGDPEVGYLLQPGFALPPLMFTEDEIQAVSLGAKWVAESADNEFSAAAKNILAKIAAVVPEQVRQQIDTSQLLIDAARTPDKEKQLLQMLRTAIQKQQKATIHYVDGKGRTTVRTIWPFGLAFFVNASIVVAWCENRGAVRHFRTDRIREYSSTGKQYPRSRDALLTEWRRDMATKE